MNDHPEWSNPRAAGPYLPRFLSNDDPRSARDQINANYISGWNAFAGFELAKMKNLAGQSLHLYCLRYPGDPAMKERSRATLRNEMVVLFDYDWIAIIQEDGTYEVARCD